VKLALVHDWLNQVGGAEDVLAALVDLFPRSPVYTSIYDQAAMPSHFQHRDIRTLWLDHLPGIYRHHQPYLPLYPLAWGGLNLSDDVILSNKSGFCHGLKYGPETLHICYCLAPTRYVWQLDAYIAREGLGKAAELALRPLVAWLKRWDYDAAQRVHHFIAISTEVQQRIQAYYDHSSVIIYPPVDTERFHVPTAEPEDYFLVVSRLIPYKRIDLAVQAASRLGLRLKVGGRGRDLERLKALAGPTVEFLGYVPDDELPGLMARAKALIFPGLEDFGITPVQSQAAGRPVIAYGGGGALDTVIPGKTGEHFEELTVESLATAMESFDPSAYDPTILRKHAAHFDRTIFAQQITTFVEQAYAAFRNDQPFVWNPTQQGEISTWNS
jgi:glycosyltransferase involved in cell wall biosynthesis